MYLCFLKIDRIANSPFQTSNFSALWHTNFNIVPLPSTQRCVISVVSSVKLYAYFSSKIQFWDLEIIKTGKDVAANASLLFV